MDTIRIFVEELIRFTGLTGTSVQVLRHVVLVLVAILLSWLSGYICRRILIPLVHRLTRHTAVTWDDDLLNDTVLKSACRIVPAVVVWWLLPLVFYQFPVVREVLTRLTNVYITVMTVRLATSFLNSVQRMEISHSSNTRQYMRSFCGVLKIVAIFIGAVASVAILLGKSPATLFAGLGATSAILMLVFKDTIEGLVAGIRLTSNNMLHVGDWITVNSADADGTVTEMTLTTVKIENFDNSITTVSPLALVNGSFRNWDNMQKSAGRRVKRKLFFDFRSIRLVSEAQKQVLVENGLATAAQLQGNVVNLTLFRTYMENVLRGMKEVNDELTLMVRQLEPTATGLPVEFYFFLRNKEWVHFEHTQAAVMERIYAVVPLFGLSVYQQFSEQPKV